MSENEPHAPLWNAFSSYVLWLGGSWDALHAVAPERLYHYTGAAGLVGIITGQSIWASHSAYLNDESERSYALNLLSRVMTVEARQTTDAQYRRYLEQSKEHWLQTLGQQDIYVACFCEQGDLLSQWRGYAGRTGGYSLGFHARFWHSTFFNSPVELVKVIYDSNQQFATISEWVQKLYGDLRNAEDPDSFSEIEQTRNIFGTAFLSGLREILARSAVSFKDPAFQEEQEWRLVTLRSRVPVSGSWAPGDPPDDVRFRIADNRLVPYVTISPVSAAGVFRGRLALELVTVGPSPTPQLSREAVDMLLFRNGYRGPMTTVINSNVPLRG